MGVGAWIIGLIVAVGVTLLAAEAWPSLVNAVLILVLVGIVLSRWNEIAPVVRLAGRVASGESPARSAPAAPVSASAAAASRLQATSDNLTDWLNTAGDRIFGVKRDK